MFKNERSPNTPSINRRSARLDAQMSSSKTCSAGEWLIPPVHRTNSIPTCIHIHMSMQLMHAADKHVNVYKGRSSK
jgi:hypothetical protein